VAAVLAVCCVRCGPCRLLCGGGGGVPCGGKHIIINVGQWLYLDAEVLVYLWYSFPRTLFLLAADLRRHPTLAALGLAES